MATQPPSHAYIVADPRLVLLLSGVDSIYLSGRSRLPEDLVDRLEIARTLAQNRGESVDFELGAKDFVMRPHGWRRYRYCLVHPYGQIGLSPSEHLPTVYVQPVAGIIHAEGAAGAVDWFATVVSNAGMDCQWSVSRIDLHTDWQGWDLGPDDRHRFLCRASTAVTFEEHGRFTGLQFGRRTSGISARIYDKTIEAADRLGVYEALWGDSFDQTTRVLRVEFEIRRAALKQFGVTTPAEALAGVDDIYQYMATKWLSLRSPTPDETKSRWPVDSVWQQIASASLTGRTIGITRAKSSVRRATENQLMQQLYGCMTSLGAVVRAERLEGFLDSLPTLVDRYERMTGKRFSDEIQSKYRKRMPF